MYFIDGIIAEYLSNLMDSKMIDIILYTIDNSILFPELKSPSRCLKFSSFFISLLVNVRRMMLLVLRMKKFNKGSSETMTRDFLHQKHKWNVSLVNLIVIKETLTNKKFKLSGNSRKFEILLRMIKKQNYYY